MAKSKTLRANGGRPSVAVALVVAALAAVVVAIGGVARAPIAQAAAPIAVVGDSLTAENPDELRAQLTGIGWGTVTINAAGGRTVLDPGPFDSFSGLSAVDEIRARSGDTPYWVVALGTNDLFKADPNQAASYITAMVDRIGPGHRILWVGVHLRDSPDLAAKWNNALVAVAATRPGRLFPYDWASIGSRHPDWVLPDRIHYNEAGFSLRAAEVAQATRALVQDFSLATPSQPAFPQADNEAADFQPIGPNRVYDTRGGAPLSAGATVVVQVADGGANAAAVQITTDRAAGSGFATVWACDRARPTTSAVNYYPDAPASNGAIVSLSNGSFCLSVSQSTHVVVDVSGVFRPSGGLRFFPRNEPLRLADTRGRAPAEAAGSVLRIGVPSGDGGFPRAAALTVTAVDPRAPGWLTLYPCDRERPVASVANYRVGETVAGTALVPVAGDGAICLYTSAETALIVDLAGEFTDNGSGRRYQAATPRRVLDTRFGLGGWLGILAPNQTVSVGPNLPDGAVAVGNLTVVSPGAGGYLTTWSGDGQRPTASVLNLQPPITRPNVVVARPGSENKISVFSSGGHHHLLFDLTGWFTF